MTTGMRGRAVRLAAAGFVASIVGGCAMPDASNPTLTINRAQVAGERAMLDVTIANQSDFDLRLKSIDYTLTYGPLPVARGTWPGDKELLSKGSVNLRLPVNFDMPPLDPTAQEVELDGVMHFDDNSNSGAKQMSEASFRATGKVRR